MDVYKVDTGFPEEIDSSRCPVEGKEGSPFSTGTLVVKCPVCGRWHHLDCWTMNENRCSMFGCPGTEEPTSRIKNRPPSDLPSDSQPDHVPPSSSPEVDKHIFDQIRIIEQTPDRTAWPEQPIIIEPWEVEPQIIHNAGSFGKSVEAYVKSLVSLSNHSLVARVVIVIVWIVIIFGCLSTLFAIFSGS